MALELNQIKEILQKPKKAQIIRQANLLQKRLRFHTETAVSLSDFNMPAEIFLNWVKTLLPKDKYNIFLRLFKYPLPTSAVVEDVYRELERVFYSRNSSSSYQFTNTELEDDWVNYRISALHEPDIWKTEGWKKMQVSPNSVLVVDLPPVQTSFRPEPYFYWLEITDVIDYETCDGTCLHWIVFKQPENRIAVFDDTYIRVYQLDDDKLKIKSLVTEVTHGLGFCPARFFWLTKLNEKNTDLKKNPITKKLSDLDWYLFFALSKQHLDLYAPYPIYSAYEADCNYENNETGDYCDGGFLRNEKGEYKVLADGTYERCPICSSKHITGPGSFVEVPIPNQAEGIADMRNPISITTIDKDSLTYNVDECVRLRNDIIVSIVGSGGGVVSEKEAINETQVAANFESKTSVLNSLKTNFEQAQKFVEDTICKLRYGDEFVSSSISWGTEFYVFTIKELYDKYETAKKNGMSESELDAIVQQIVEVEYRNNPQVLQKMLILKQLEPYPHKTLDEVITLSDKGLLEKKKVLLKLNFSNYIDRFERENISIVHFGVNKPLKERISIIYKKLLEYATEDEKAATAGAGEAANREGGTSNGEES